MNKSQRQNVIKYILINTVFNHERVYVALFKIEFFNSFIVIIDSEEIYNCVFTELFNK